METAIQEVAGFDEAALQELWQQEEKRKEQERLARLSGFASAIADKRKEAIDGRVMSGIENIWRADEEYYAGIDEMNRAESILKPSTPNGRVIIKSGEEETARSTVFMNITQPYVDMAAARASDVLLPTDDRPFRYKNTPIPEVSKFTQSTLLMPDGKTTVGEASQQFIGEMTERVNGAEQQVWDWVVESRWHGEMRKVIDQSAKIGTSILKGPFPVKRKIRTMAKDETGIHLVLEEKTKPASKWLDVWKFFPDPSCGDNIHNGRYVFEKDDITARQLRDLRGGNYIDAEIEELLKEGPGKRNIETGRQDPILDSELYEIWYFYGDADADDLRAAGCKCNDGVSIPVHVVMVNDRIIKASLQVLNSGEFPYDVMRWTYVADSWAGLGVARQVRTAQRMVNAGTRNLMDNAGVSAGPQIIVNEDVIVPADGKWTLTPLKLWRFSGEDSDVAEVAHAIMSIEIPSMQAELEKIIRLALEFAERATNMPLLLQGQQGASTETVGGMQILNANGSTVTRRIAKIADDDVIEPHFLRYYEYLMLYGKDELKGDYTVDALGSTAFYERDAQAQMIMQLVPMSNDPEFKLSKHRLMAEILKANKISPEKVLVTDDEWKQYQENLQKNPPVDPRVAGAKEVATINAQASMEKAKLVQQSDMAEIERKNEMLTNEFSLKLKLQEMEHAHQERIKKLEYDMKLMELAQNQKISIESIKASLADTTIRLKVQKELSERKGGAEQVATPPSEPYGRAPNGEAYQK